MGKIIKSKMNDTRKPNEYLDPKKRIIFSIILVLIPFIILLIIEFFLRIINYGDNYNLFMDYNFYGKEYRKCNPEFGKKYFYRFQNSVPPNDIFLKQKPENGFRIFVMGSSTVFGFPYSSGIMFSRILQERLEDSYPGKHIEVINTSITAVNSYTLLDKINDIIKEKPDAILIYAGHNEFYGALGIGSKEGLGKIRWLKLLHLNLLELKIYQLIRNIIYGIQGSLNTGADNSDSTTATLMERIAANKNIEFGTNIYYSAHKQYRKNIKAMLKKVNKKHIPVIISEVISNIRDLEPFCSVSTGEYPAAIDIFNEGRKSDHTGEYKKAKELYYLAKDLDCIRFRASEKINEIIRELAVQYDAYLVPMKDYFENRSVNELIGNNLLTEHVHPNIDGYFLMADAFYNIITGNNIIEKLDSSYFNASEYYRDNWGFTDLDSIYADLKIRQLKGGWPFKPENIVNKFIYEYKPASIVDSLAYLAVRYDDISLDIAHKKMAKYHLTHKDFMKAAEEYYSLIKISPYDIRNYIEAGNLLLEVSEYDKALALFLSALKIKKESYILSKIGELYYNQGEYRKSISFLEEVKSIDPDYSRKDVLNMLYQAYKANNENDKARGISNELATLQKTGKEEDNVIIYTPSSVKEYINQALIHLQSKNIDEALDILYKANKIQETSISNRLIGEILLQKEDKKALIYLKKAYYEFSSDPNFLNTLCYACIYNNDLSYAEKILLELKQLSPDSEKVRLYENMISQRRKGN
jgi:tetratricopeptide (TPR) repeat protein/lysophospholipase L1-like esterase